jgi:IS5 family transposase
MSEQRTLASVVYDTKGKVTRRARFLRKMDAVIPWPTLHALIEPHYTKPGRGRRPLPLETMRRFARVELGEDTVPDESTILRFRHLLEQHQLTAAMFEAVKTLLTEKRLLLKAGTIVDATIIAAPSSTKNATQARDPEMKQTRKGQQWYFGMKIHVGTDTRGVVHSLTTTDAAVADISQLTHLVRGSETTRFVDKAHYKTEHQLHWEASGGRYRVNKSGKRTAHGDRINATRSRTRARGEHAFRIVKQLWGFAKVRYRGLAKNTARAFAAFALANLYVLRHRLVPQGT